MNNIGDNSVQDRNIRDHKKRNGNTGSSHQQNGAKACHDKVRVVAMPPPADAVAHNTQLEASDAFVITPYLHEIVERAQTYLEAGYPVHFAGPAGTGKTTLAFHMAALRGQPVTLIHGNDEFDSSDLTGKDAGYHRSRMVDNYIHSVVKTEEEIRRLWEANRLTLACRQGDTLIYDEFNRSRPEANNVLLSVLSERVLNISGQRGNSENYINVHENFCAIFTSNPEEYAGTHKTQDALMDRIITINLQHPDRDTEIAIIEAKSGIDPGDAERIVAVVRALRERHPKTARPTIRAGIAIARILKQRNGRACRDDAFFHRLCHDILASDCNRLLLPPDATQARNDLDSVIRRLCTTSPHPSNTRVKS